MIMRFAVFAVLPVLFLRRYPYFGLLVEELEYGLIPCEIIHIQLHFMKKTLPCVESALVRHKKVNHCKDDHHPGAPEKCFHGIGAIVAEGLQKGIHEPVEKAVEREIPTHFVREEDGLDVFPLDIAFIGREHITLCFEGSVKG